MEVNYLYKPKQIEHKALARDGDDVNFVSSLSAVYVATIQEAQAKISQVEYFFCNELYPEFHKITKCQQEIFADAKSAAECEWKGKESMLLLQIQNLLEEKDKALGDCESLRSEKLKAVKRVAELEEKILQKSKEVDEGMKLHNKLLHLLESKNRVIASKEELLKEQEEKMSVLLAKSEGLEKKLCMLEAELLEKNEEVSKAKAYRAELIRQVESQESKMVSLEQMLYSKAEERNQVLVQLEDMRNEYDILKDELHRKRSKTEELKRQEVKFFQQINEMCLEVARKDQQFEAQGREKGMLLTRIRDLESKIKQNAGNSETSKCCQNLAQQIEVKSSELSSQKQKTRELFDRYKKLKSQYNFLLAQNGLTTQNMRSRTLTDSGNDPHGHHLSKDVGYEIPSTKVESRWPAQVKEEIVSPENSKDVKAVVVNQTSGSNSSHRFNSPVAPKHSPHSSNSPVAPKRVPIRCNDKHSGAKRRASNWRDTRSRQSPFGHDPHDDFLDTPYENMRKTDQNPASNDIANDSSDEENQAPGANPGIQKRPLEAPRLGSNGFKYVEPVRKKSEREKLKGVECKQCERFYDAVLPDRTDNNEKKFRCEHLDGVSRHRYRYVPPLTPEGYWNIGFESDL